MTVSIGFVVTPQSMADLAATGEDADERLGVQISYSAFNRPGKVAEVAFLFDTIVDERNSWLSGTDIYFDNGCEANGYMGNFEIISALELKKQLFPMALTLTFRSAVTPYGGYQGNI